MSHWAQGAVFYHIYPLGLCGAPATNDFASKPMCRLNKILGWIGHLKEMGVSAVYFGPVFESTSHGYDTADYLHVDRRLGTNADFKRIVAALHENGIKVVIDAVFNHVGRDFWAFKDVRDNRAKSRYCSWFAGLNFTRRSPFHDPFWYEGWNGHYNLVKLNLTNPEVKNHLFCAARTWIEQFMVDGFRLDAADCLDRGFMSDLAGFCKQIRSDFWQVGEVIHGDYGQWVRAGLDSVTNYECYKGLWSSHNDANYFEIAYSLNRQFGEQGLYRQFLPYSFVDNHDVNRVASVLKNKSHLYPVYILLFTMPGIPSIYYGSEWGIEGEKTKSSDEKLRPYLELRRILSDAPEPELVKVISQLAHIRQRSEALKRGGYQQIHVHHQQFVFTRNEGKESVLVAVNSASQRVNVEIAAPRGHDGRMEDQLNEGEVFEWEAGKCTISIGPNWGRILARN